MTLPQDNRKLRVETPLGQDVLILTGIISRESISSPFSYWLDLVSERRDITADEIVGANVTFSLRLSDGQERYFNGMVNTFMHEHSALEDDDERSTFIYKAEIVPWFVSLRRTCNCRIFQEKSVPEIIEQIFSDRTLNDFDMQLNTSYPTRTYCVQYRESDYDFIVRLMAYEGMFYFFRHENGRHTMVIGDSADTFKPCPGQETARYQPAAASGVSEDDVVTNLHDTSAQPSGRYVVNDYNFEMPNADLSSQTDSLCTMSQACDEIYDYPAVYTTKADGERIASIRMQQQEVKAKTITGNSLCRSFACGFQFALEEHPVANMNTDFLLTAVHWSVREPAGESSGAPAVRYRNGFTCIPMEVPFRPALINTKPMIQGIQTAFVVGEGSDEIYTDDYGRIKIQFHWDRYGEKNEHSSCWIRVAQPLAGPGYGTTFIPRVGHEVVVSFIEGDPDRPVVTGSLYNAANMPPYNLPGHKNMTTIKTCSTPDDSGYNELRFDDTAGSEQIFLHAEGSRDTIVKGSWRETVGGEKHETVKTHKIVKVEGDMGLTATALGISTEEFIQINGDDISLDAGRHMQVWGFSDCYVLGGKVLIECMHGGICLKFNDDNYINIHSGGVDIVGSRVSINDSVPTSPFSLDLLDTDEWDDPALASSGRPPQEPEPGERPFTQRSRETGSQQSTAISQNQNLILGEAERIDPSEVSGEERQGSDRQFILGEAERIDPSEVGGEEGQGGDRQLILGDAERIDEDD